MYYMYIGCLSISGYITVLLRWFPGGSFAAPLLTFVTSAVQCRFWQRVGCCGLPRGVRFWSLGPIYLLCSDGPLRLWHYHGMISPLSCVPLQMARTSKFCISLKSFFFGRDWTWSAYE